MPDLFPITTADKIAELRRELVMRRQVYARWVEIGTLAPEQAERRIAIMEAILADYETADRWQPHSFADCVPGPLKKRTGE